MHVRAVSTVLAAAAAAVALVATPSVAGATTSVGEHGYITSACPGSQIGHGKLRDSSGNAHPTAVWRLYYSASNGGTNCLQVWDRTSGKHYMLATIQETGVRVHYATDYGTYSYYAGGVAVTRMSGRCVDWAARIDDNGKTYAAHQYYSHCG